MSLPKYQSWKNRRLYTEMQDGAVLAPQPHIPSTERNPVGNGLRQPEPPKQQVNFSHSNETAPSLQNGGPIRSSEDDWYKDILTKFQNDIRKPSPERKASLGDLGMKGVGDATFGNVGGATPPGDTPLVSGGVPVTDLKGQFDWNLNELAYGALDMGKAAGQMDEPPTGIGPTSDPPEDPKLPGQAMKYAQYIIDLLQNKNANVVQQVKGYLLTQLTQLQQKKMGAGAGKFGRMDVAGARSAMKNPVQQG